MSSNVSSRTRRRSVDMTATSSGAAATSNLNGTAAPPQRPDPIAFLASLQVDQSIVLEIVQEIISLYDLWSQLESSNNGSNGGGVSSPVAQQLGVGASARLASAASGSSSNNLGGGSTGTSTGTGKGTSDDKVISIVRRMQEARMRELREERSKQAAARKVG